MGREFWVLILATNPDVFEVVSKQAVFMSENGCGVVDLLKEGAGFEHTVGPFALVVSLWVFFPGTRVTSGHTGLSD